MPAQPVTLSQIRDFQTHESIMLIGNGSCGKTYSILCTAKMWKMMHPTGRVYILDLEAGIAKTWKKSFLDVDNIDLYHGTDIRSIDQFLEIFNTVAAKSGPEDLLIFESDTKIWDLAEQDAWFVITGMSKDAYMSKRIEDIKDSRKARALSPSPDNLWQIAGDSYKRRFRDVITDDLRLKTNIIITAGVKKPSAGQHTSSSRKEIMNLLGEGIFADGHADTPRCVDTVIYLTKESDGYFAEILKDRGYDKPAQKIKFRVNNFWADFIVSCRVG
jgi:hypothetical protein